MVNVSPLLIDEHQRVMKKLRVSLTDVCNYACNYCMPEDAEFSPRYNHMDPNTFVELISKMVNLGIKELRVTGGEPLMRPEFPQIMRLLGELPAKLHLTTNGQLLERHLPLLKECNVQGINISLDSLDEGKFHRITKGGNLNKVLSAIKQSVKLGFKTKINCVPMRGINDDEIESMIEWAQESGVELRFLELMRIGPMQKENQKYFISAQEMREKLTHLDLSPVKVDADSTSQVYLTNLGTTPIGIIASETEAFCSSCSRLRLSSNGILRSCLMKEEGTSIKGLSSQEFNETVQNVIAQKPIGRIEYVNHSMNSIGG